ncbi:UDP-glycosyltransferase 83A1 [Durusdinium trenchii]|uniref:UDP-glycosyltransferase 83A1 n=1 Tax=Durusdinium trenchii TaxID=1381693 RepID=A0ABP0HN46_9DINO
MGQLWEVVGGATGGGILVREGEKLGSAELPQRLSTGAIIRQKELKGERLCFDLVCGDGPTTGWVSLKLKGRDLVVPYKDGAPFWLKPSRVKGRVLFLSIPWKGHIVHLRRIGQWFLGRPNYQMHFACMQGDKDELEKLGFEVHATNDDENICSDFFAVIEDGFREIVRSSATAQSQGGSTLWLHIVRHLADFADKKQDPMASFLSFCFRVLCIVKPDVVVCDGFCTMNNLVPAWCEAENIRLLPVHSPGIPEDMEKNMEKEGESIETQRKIPREIDAKAMGVSVEVIKALEQKVDPSQMPQVNSNELTLMGLMLTVGSLPPEMVGFMTAPLAKKLKVPIKVASTILKNLKTDNYVAEIYASTRSVVGQKTSKERVLFCSPLLPLPKPLEGGRLQRDRESFEATVAPIEKDLLEWLFCKEHTSPIVYVAFGSIVRPSKEMIEKLAKALDGDSWRVLWVLPQEIQSFLPTDRPNARRWRVEAFVPQADVLKCERIRCFLSHMGANSTTESLVCSVPMLCCPFYMDQFEWTWTVCEHLGAGLQIGKASSIEEIQLKLRRLLDEPQFTERAAWISQVMRSQAEGMLSKLGPDMEPPENTPLGVGASVAAAVILASLVKESPDWLLKAVEETTKAAEAAVPKP